MRMTQAMEDRLIACLQRGSISIPELQLELELSYKDACSLIEYAQGRKWIGDHQDGIDYPVIATKLARVELPQDVCQKIYDVLSYDALHVLYFLGARFNATFQDILDEVDHDKDDMTEAIADLTSASIIFRHESDYYCKISEASVEAVKTHGATQASDTPLRRRP